MQLSRSLSLYPFVSISSIQVHWSKNWNERGKEVQQVTPLSYDSLLFAREYSIQQRISSKWVLAKVFTQTHSYTYIMLLTCFLVISILFRLSFAWRVCVCSMSASQKKLLKNNDFARTKTHIRRPKLRTIHIHMPGEHWTHWTVHNVCIKCISKFDVQSLASPLLIAILIDQ